jgi:DNA-binding protein YbaB
MLDGVKNAISTAGNMNKARNTQAKLQKMLQDIVVSGISKNGKVKVSVTGEQKITEVIIDPALIQFVNDNYFTSEDQNAVKKGQKMISDNIMEASNDAISKVQVEMVKKMQENGGMGELMSMFKDMS